MLFSCGYRARISHMEYTAQVPLAITAVWRLLTWTSWDLAIKMNLISYLYWYYWHGLGYTQKICVRDGESHYILLKDYGTKHFIFLQKNSNWWIVLHETRDIFFLRKVMGLILILCFKTSEFQYLIFISRWSKIL